MLEDVGGSRAGIWDLGLWDGYGSPGWDLGFRAGIWALRPGFELRGWDLGRKAGIGAW